MIRRLLATTGAAALVVTGAVPALAVGAATSTAPTAAPAAAAAGAVGAVAAPSPDSGRDGSRDTTGRLVPAAVQRQVTGQVVATTEAVKWTRCGGAQCATVTVPLDYANPGGGTVDLDVTRRPADTRDPKQRLGILVTNPGGPGTPAAFTVPLFAQITGREVRNRFDIIGINPRGMTNAAPALCTGTEGGQMPPTLEALFPTTPAQVQAQLAYDAYTIALCRKDNPAILRHMSTGDSARDIDAVRAALGEQDVNFYGVSYGSVLGATYSQLFPSRVRTMVVDGTLDPIAWTGGRRGEGATVPMTTRLGSHLGGQKALMSAIAECERLGEAYCAEHKTIRQDWQTLRKLAGTPISLGEDFSLTWDLVVAIVNSGLYDYEGVPDVLGLIHQLSLLAQSGGNPPQAVQAKAYAAYTKVMARDAANRKSRLAYDPPAPVEEPAPTPMYFAGFSGVVCDDGVHPRDPQAWVRAAASADRVAPGFGSLWTWTSSVCARWPFHSPGAVRGTFDKPAKGGLLILNTTNDPATPYAGAHAARRLRADSRLVTVPGWGHAVLDTSGCATRIRTRYLVSGRLPGGDVTCAQDHNLFQRLS